MKIKFRRKKKTKKKIKKMKKLLFLSLTLLTLSCSTDTTETFDFTTPEWSRGEWKNTDTNKTVLVEEHKVTIEGNTRTIVITQGVQGATSEDNAYWNLFLEENGTLAFQKHTSSIMFISYFSPNLNNQPNIEGETYLKQ